MFLPVRPQANLRSPRSRPHLPSRKQVFLLSLLRRQRSKFRRQTARSSSRKTRAAGLRALKRLLWTAALLAGMQLLAARGKRA
jgi:hypothetical protein